MSIRPGRRSRLLIFIVAYYAESTLVDVLERIPRGVFEEFDCEILIVDDASADRTFQLGRAYQRIHPEIRMKILRNAYNQGYGGNQKVGYTYAIQEGFDWVALLHGDGQYAPEELPNLIAPLEAGRAEAVFGSRMMTRFGALKGGMPLYKFVGNRILTALQNLLLGSTLSEFHSGYRLYSVKALAQIPFRLNSNDFHFDTEIIIQFLNARHRIVELAIPTYYGDEICRVNGIGYAVNVMRATLRNWAHRAGILYQRSFDTKADANDYYGLKLGYPSSHTNALAVVPDGARVADIGAGPIGLGKELLRKKCRVVAVDRFAPRDRLEGIEYVEQNLNAALTVDLRDCSHILLLDILEHLNSPEDFLAGLRAQFDHRPRTVIITTPNVAFLVTRLMLLAGQFNYSKMGILDMTHTRLFTFRSLRRLLVDEGFRIRQLRGIPAPFPKALGDGRLARLLLAVNLLLMRLSKGLFSYQIFVECEATPSVRFLLEDAKGSAVNRA